MTMDADWIASVLLKGDSDAIAEIRRRTLSFAGAPHDDEAAVYLWNGVWVKGEGDASHLVPPPVLASYVHMPPPPGLPEARWPEGATRPSGNDAHPSQDRTQTPREAMLSESLGKAEGSPRGIAQIIERTRLVHEIVPEMFPTDAELHWFPNGLYVLGPGPNPSVYQTPMTRVEDLLRPREYPKPPEIREWFG